MASSVSGTDPRRRAAPVLLTLGQGLLMGCADVVPGVSGGTVALIVGIYERLITSIRSAASAPVLLLRGDVAAARRRLAETEWWLVVPLGIGIVVALGIGAAVIPGLLEAYPVQMLAIFFGLIAGSLVVPWRRVDQRGRVELGVVVAAALTAFVLVGLPPRSVADPSLLRVFATAMVAICAMILPGVSGAFLLLVLGIYEPTLEAVSERDLVYVAVFGAGCALGLGLFSRLLEHLLTRHHSLTMAVLVGLMAGSLRALWPWQTADRGLLAPPLSSQLLGALALAVLAAAAVTVLTRAGASVGREDLPLHD